MATGPEHFKAAERLTDSAGAWMDADHGWKGSLSGVERVARRAGDLAEAQVHATLALAAATALTVVSPDGSYYPLDEDAWHQAAGTGAAGEEKQA
jgi:hypothetical protein